MRAHDGNGLVRGSSLILEKERTRKKKKKGSGGGCYCFPCNRIAELVVGLCPPHYNDHDDWYNDKAVSVRGVLN